jgi:hypothetical protein
MLHVGLICELRSLVQGGTKIPWILSKWDDTLGEVFHHFMDVPWPEDFSVAFWTDRT